MRCVAYVSRVPFSDRGIRLPKGLSDIVLISRQSNPLSQITGIISYREEQYFQVLEGPKQEIDKLFSKILADSRHEDIWVFLDMPITRRCFGNWGVSVFDFVDQGPFFKEFIRSNQYIINAFTAEQKQRIQSFIGIEKPIEAENIRYDGKLLRLKAWPDLNNISQPQVVIDLCVKLTKKPYAFDSLVSANEFGTYEQVVEIISDFDKLGILAISEPVVKAAAEPTQEQVIEQKKPNKFYGAIKRFLGMG